MIQCPNCNAENNDTDIFCPNCGFSLSLKHLKVNYQEPTLSSDILERYQQLEDKISGLEGIEEEIQQAYKYHQSLQQEARKMEEVYNQRQKEAQKEFKDVEDLKKLTWKSLKSRIGGKKQQLLEVEEKEYFEAIQHEEEAKNDLNEITRRLNSAFNQLKHLQELGQKRHDLEKKIENLLEEVYKGSMGDTKENVLESDVEDLKNQKNPVFQEQRTLQTALGHLQNARDHLNAGLERLNSAMGYSNWDTFFGGGFFVDSMKHNRVSDARNAVMQGHFSLERAFSIYPNLPRVQRANVQEGSMFWDTFFDNIFSDMNARQRIQDSLYSVRTTLSDVGSAILWVNNKLSEFSTKLESLDNQIVSKRMQLKDRRKELITEHLGTKKN